MLNTSCYTSLHYLIIILNTFKSSYFTDKQLQLLLGILLTDGYLEISATAGERANYRVGVNQSKMHYSLLDAIQNELQPYGGTIGKEQLKDAPLSTSSKERGEKKHAQKQLRTPRHPAFTELATVFGNPKPKSKKKIVPSASFLKTYLTWFAFAWIIMFDGSTKQPGKSQAIELHLQNFDYEEQSYLCIALYFILGIQCWPVKHKVHQGKQLYNIMISGRSLCCIRNNVKRYMLPEVAHRLPPELKNGGSPTPHPVWLRWYKQYKDLFDFK